MRKRISGFLNNAWCSDALAACLQLQACHSRLTQAALFYIVTGSILPRISWAHLVRPPVVCDTAAEEDGYHTVGGFWYLQADTSPSCIPVQIPITIVVEKKGATLPTSSGSTTAPPATVSCESNGFVLSWIMCPVVEGLADADDPRQEP